MAIHQWPRYGYRGGVFKMGGDRVNPSNRAFRVFYRSGGGRDIVTRDREFTNLFRPRVSAIERP